MPVKQTTTNQYSPQGMAAYNQLVPQATSTLGNFMQNPLQANYFKTMFGMGSNQINQQQSGIMATLMNNMKQFGGGMGGGTNPFLMSQLSQSGRSASGQKSNLFGGLLQQAIGNQMNAANIGSSFKPLQTGTTQQMSGLGTWLPQVISGVMGAVSGGLTGGVGGALGAFGSQGLGMPSPMPSSANYGNPMAPNINSPTVGGFGLNYGGQLQNGPNPYGMS